MSARTSSGKIITVLSLIIGICGLGIGGYSYYLLETQITPDINDVEDDVDDLEDEEDVYFEKEVQNTWYDEVLGSVNTLFDDSKYIDGLSIIATLYQGESIYVLFDSFVRLEGSGSNNLQFYIHVGSYQMQPFLTIQQDDTVDNIHSATLQTSTSSLDPGTYNVSVRVYSTDNDNIIYYPTLFVQTYK